MTRAWMLVSLTFLLAGCADVAEPDDDGAPVEWRSDNAAFAAEGCPLVFPDGQGVDCGEQDLTEPTSEEKPSMLDGWRCGTQYEDDFGNQNQIWAHIDGRIGAYFEGTPVKDSGVALYTVSLLHPGGGWSVHVPYQPTAFVELPAVPDADRIDMRIIFEHLQLFALEPGTDEWVADPEGAELIVDSFEGHPWYAWKVPKANGTFFVSPMHLDANPGSLQAWDIDDTEVRAPDGAQYISTAFGPGVKYTDMTLPPQHTVAARQDQC